MPKQRPERADEDLVRLYLSDIGKHALLTKADEATLAQAIEIQKRIGFPTIIRPSFTLGGSGGGIAYNREEFEQIVEHGLDMSPTKEVLLEESVPLDHRHRIVDSAGNHYRVVRYERAERIDVLENDIKTLREEFAEFRKQLE